jgi:hypothetical protein
MQQLDQDFGSGYYISLVPVFADWSIKTERAFSERFRKADNSPAL